MRATDEGGARGFRDLPRPEAEEGHAIARAQGDAVGDAGRGRHLGRRADRSPGATRGGDVRRGRTRPRRSTAGILRRRMRRAFSPGGGGGFQNRARSERRPAEAAGGDTDSGARAGEDRARRRRDRHRARVGCDESGEGGGVVVESAPGHFFVVGCCVVRRGAAVQPPRVHFLVLTRHGSSGRRASVATGTPPALAPNPFSLARGTAAPRLSRWCARFRARYPAFPATPPVPARATSRP